MAALAAADARRLEHVVLPRSDHSFSADRIALARLVTGWLAGSCSS